MRAGEFLTEDLLHEDELPMPDWRRIRADNHVNSHDVVRKMDKALLDYSSQEGNLTEFSNWAHDHNARKMPPEMQPPAHEDRWSFKDTNYPLPTTGIMQVIADNLYKSKGWIPDFKLWRHWNQLVRKEGEITPPIFEQYMLTRL
ncbi:MAG: hypothetical protein DRI24_23485, partial [Deltaproteobacteria bacterium]